MSNNLALHAHRVNLARRWSVQNEPDLVMENLYEDDETLRMNNKKYSRQECESIASHLMHLNQLPVQCMKYKEVALDLKRRDSDTTHGTAILS